MRASRSDPATGPAAPGWVVCGVDGSQRAADASWAAARGARDLGLGLQLVRAFEWPATGVPGLPAGDLGRAVARRSAMGEVFRLVDGLAAAHPSTPAAGALTDGTALAVLTAATERTALAVVGAQGQSWPDGPRTGSVALGVARTTHCPLLVHRSTAVAVDARRRVVVSVDGGPATVHLLEIATRAAGDDGQLVVVDDSPTDRDAGALLDHGVDALRAAHPGLQVLRHRHLGSPGSLLVQLSGSASLVVVGRPPEALHVPLSARIGLVLRRGTCSTLVVPPRRPG